MRVQEVGEDLPWARLAVRLLEGRQVPIERDQVLYHWKKAGLPDLLRAQTASSAQTDKASLVRTGPRHPDDLPRLIEELIGLGVMRSRSDERLDLPDVYRIASRVGRRGGVPMAAG